MPWGVAAAVVGVAGAVYSADASKSAASKQAGAADSAAAAQLAQFNTINDQQAPYRLAGYGALNDLQSGLGHQTSAPAKDQAGFDAAAYLAANPDVANNPNWSKDPWAHYQQHGQSEGRDYTPNAQYNQQLAQSQQTPTGNFTHAFDINDLNANMAPNYAFMLDQGQKTNINANNATGGLVSGNALQGLNTFSQNYAQNAYQQAYQNYNANQTNIFNRLADIAGIGQTANQTTANAGISTAQSASNYLTSGAAASAAGTVGSANAVTSGINNAAGWGYLYGGGGRNTWTPEQETAQLNSQIAASPNGL
jgi:hypothetical protein